MRAALSAAFAVCAVTAVLPGAARAEPTGPADFRATAVERVSVAVDGTQGDGDSTGASITPDGSRIAFLSSAGTLTPAPGPPPGGNRVYVRDQRTARLMQLGNDGPLAPPVISSDGGYVAYPVPVMRDELVRQYQLSTGRAIAKDCSAYNCRVSLGTEGRYLAYGMLFRPPEPNQRIEVFDWDTGTARTIDIIHNTRPSSPSLSDDGRYLAYQDGGEQDVFLWDRTDGTPSGPIEGPGRAATLVQLSDDGSKVVYRSGSDTYVHDTATGTALPVPDVRGVAIDPTGTYLLYAPHGTNGPALTLRDLRTGTDEIVSNQPASAGTDAVSAGGRDVVFQSTAADLVPGDTNGKSDVFLRTFR
ncbi:WD40 repeat domain-containing protein [Streptomyces sp. NPDC094448]|uniref:WD40 repeat domain-containing protein n=1 Tax=Streptomyces sp. NPDC094448 TaxID=3366063 RepID=UPI0037FAB01A